MKKFFTTSDIIDLPLFLPEAAVWSRLGRNRYLSKMTGPEEIQIKLAMHKALDLCRVQGKWMLLEITRQESDWLEVDGNWRIVSREFVNFAAGSSYLFLGAVTAGGKISELIARSQDKLAEAVVYDAVGSEVADAAIGSLQKIASKQLERSNLAVSERRFSPGYGNLHLDSVQTEIFKRLKLEELGMSLSASFIMQPEKSVTAFAGVKETI